MHRYRNLLEISSLGCWSLLLLFFGLCPPPVLGQAVTTPNPQLQSVLAQARAALFTASQPTSISFDGTFTSTAGSLTKNGSAHLTLGASGTYLISLTTADGATTESRSTTDNGATSCNWTDEQGVVHKAASLNCTLPAWFFPGLNLLSSSSDTDELSWTPTSYFTDSCGNHLRFQLALSGVTSAQEDPQTSSPFDLVLAPNTSLPAYALFTARADNPGVYMGIPVRIKYSDYRNVSGVMVPFRMQRFVNGSLVLDLTITAASIQ